MRSRPRPLVWAALALVLAGFAWFSLSQDGARQFGHYHDDTLYWIAAGEIAEGRGARLPNLPGDPAMSKYPLFHPLLLSLVRRAVPDEAAALDASMALSAGFAVLGLAAWFFHLRQWKGVGENVALLCVALSAASGLLLFVSATLQSDTLFFGLAGVTLWASDSNRKHSWLATALLAGIATAARTVGVGLVGGVAVYYFLQGKRRQAVGFCGVSQLIVAAASLLKGGAVPPPPDAAVGFVQTWLYYTDYLGFWLAGMPDLDTFIGLLKKNVSWFVQVPASLLIGRPLPGPMTLILWATVTAAVFSGVRRQAAADRWRACHWAFALHVPVVLLWNFEIGDRLLLPFLPLFAVGLFAEARHAVPGFLRSLGAGKPMADRIVSAACLALLVAAGGWYANRIVSVFRTVGPGDAPYAQRYADAARYLARNTAPDARFVALDDPYLYLASGRQGMWPLAPTSDLIFNYSDERLEQQLDRFPHVADQIGARYIVWTQQDFEQAPPVAERWAAWAQSFTEVTRSKDGSVRVYDRGPEIAARPIRQAALLK